MVALEVDQGRRVHRTGHLNPGRVGSDWKGGQGFQTGQQADGRSGQTRVARYPGSAGRGLVPISPMAGGVCRRFTRRNGPTRPRSRRWWLPSCVQKRWVAKCTDLSTEPLGMAPPGRTGYHGDRIVPGHSGKTVLQVTVAGVDHSGYAVKAPSRAVPAGKHSTVSMPATTWTWSWTRPTQPGTFPRRGTSRATGGLRRTRGPRAARPGPIAPLRQECGRSRTVSRPSPRRTRRRGGAGGGARGERVKLG